MASAAEDPLALARKILELDSGDRDHDWTAREIYEPAVRLAVFLLGREAALGERAERERQETDVKLLAAAVGCRLAQAELLTGADGELIGLRLRFERDADQPDVEVALTPAGVQLVVGVEFSRRTDSEGRWRTRRDGVTEIRP